MRRITIIFSTIFSFGLLFAEQPSGDSDGHAYLELANRVFDTALSEGQAYSMLRELCLDIGPRLSGSPQAAAAVEWGRQTMQRAGLQHVRLQPVLGAALGAGNGGRSDSAQCAKRGHGGVECLCFGPERRYV